MKKFDDELETEPASREKTESAGRKQLIFLIGAAVVLFAALIFLVMLFAPKKERNDDPTDGAVEEETENQTAGMADDMTEDQEDPQNATAGSMSTEMGTSVDVAEILSAGTVAETEGVTYGIDVAKYQGTIDWQQVAASGIDFVMVRVGYRTQKTGEICADSNARYNMQEAQANGIKVGAYFFSTAVTREEAIEEADWVADYISQYQITYPVAYNCEGFENEESRQYGLSQTERTDLAIIFLNEIYGHGYTPMFYASKNELQGDAKWDTSRLEQIYRIWVSQYPAVPYPDTPSSDYQGTHAMWQYTNQASIPGIPRPADVDIAYFGYAGTADAQNSEKPDAAVADAEALMNFTEVNETVTAKEKTNLRDIPSQGDDSTVVTVLSNGETAVRTGVSDSGWSRVEYNGSVYYAVSNYLTTDLNYKVPAAEGSGDGIKTKFTETNDLMTAKIEVNLRTLPSVTNPDAVVVAVLHNGETVTRTGINTEYGWSRVEYNGQTLYCISSYLTAAE
ncbi:MAG: glycoside hydrolase family 25 [Roseburia sp.]|nr:glycoside hydrolase family 25 [Roseburia sp.]